MKATVLVPFRDKYDHAVVYSPGEVKEFDNDRAVALAARGLVEPLAEAPKEPEEKAEADADTEADAPKEAEAEDSNDNE